ncbi:MAG: gliding motility-associated C-terminal domain-containing protein [Sphingobacteriales bacterium]|nr:MAG: gliding motility-associated C-terminal domain-containing protein [Sphingobacteriales bacterium]
MPRPVALPQDDIDYVVRVENAAGCFDTDTIRVKAYLLQPDFYVPSAFTPDGDGNNDRFRPIALGLKSMDAFRVYNRWGQLVYSSRNPRDAGWDGKIKGQVQESGTYVWYAEGVTYLNQKIERKGSVILIR